MTRLTVVLEASCLIDARRDGGIGRYGRQLSAALGQLPELEVHLAAPRRPPRSESRPERFLHAQRPLLRATRGIRPHLVHGIGGEPVLGWPLHRQVVTVHDVEMWRNRGRGLRSAALDMHGRVLASLLRGCAAIIAVSEATAAEAMETLRLQPSRVHVVPHGVSPAFGPTAAPGDAGGLEAAGLAGRPYLLWVGSLRHHDPRKGLDILLDALGRLTDPPVLALAGATGPESGRLAARAREMGLEVVLCGRRDDQELSALYRGAAAVVVPSSHEGFGFPVLEAMACGAPVVATRAGNIPAVAGGAALLVDHGAPGVLADAIGGVLQPETAARLRAAGLGRAAEFSWPRCASLTAAVYRRAISGD